MIKIDDVTVARVALGCISDVGINPLSLNRRIKYTSIINCIPGLRLWRGSSIHLNHFNKLWLIIRGTNKKPGKIEIFIPLASTKEGNYSLYPSRAIRWINKKQRHKKKKNTVAPKSYLGTVPSLKNNYSVVIDTRDKFYSLEPPFPALVRNNKDNIVVIVSRVSPLYRYNWTIVKSTTKRISPLITHVSSTWFPRVIYFFLLQPSQPSWTRRHRPTADNYRCN